MRRGKIVLVVLMIIMGRSICSAMRPSEERLVDYLLQESAIELVLGEKLGIEVQPTKRGLANIKYCLDDRSITDVYIGMMHRGVESLMILEGPESIKVIEYGEVVIATAKSNESVRVAVLLLDEFCKKSGWTAELGIGEREKNVIADAREALGSKGMNEVESGLRLVVGASLKDPLLDSVVSWLFMGEMEKRGLCKEGMRYALERKEYWGSAIRWLSFLSKESNREAVELTLGWIRENIEMCRKEPQMQGAILGLISTRAAKTKENDALIEKTVEGAIIYSKMSEIYPTEEERKHLLNMLIEKNPDISKDTLEFFKEVVANPEKAIGFGYNDRHLYEFGFKAREYLEIRHIKREDLKDYLLEWDDGVRVVQEVRRSLDPRTELEREGRNNAKIKIAHRFFLEDVKKKTEGEMKNRDIEFIP